MPIAAVNKSNSSNMLSLLCAGTLVTPEYSKLEYAGRAGMLQRLSYAIQCDLENEFDWALNALLMLSFDDRPERYKCRFLSQTIGFTCDLCSASGLPAKRSDP